MSFLKKAFSKNIRQEVTLTVHQVILDGGNSDTSFFNFSDSVRVVFRRERRIKESQYKQVKMSKAGNGLVEMEESLTLPVTFFRSSDGKIIEKIGSLDIESITDKLGSAQTGPKKLGSAKLLLSTYYQQLYNRDLTVPILAEKSLKQIGTVSFTFNSEDHDGEGSDIDSSVGGSSYPNSVTSTPIRPTSMQQGQSPSSVAMKPLEEKSKPEVAETKEYLSTVIISSETFPDPVGTKKSPSRRPSVLKSVEDSSEQHDTPKETDVPDSVLLALNNESEAQQPLSTSNNDVIQKPIDEISREHTSTPPHEHLESKHPPVDHLDVENLRSEVITLREAQILANKEINELKTENETLKAQCQVLGQMVEDLKKRLVNQSPIVPISLSSEVIWEKDSDHTKCMNATCNLSFTLTRRRHHCRACGKIFCHSCSSKTLPRINITVLRSGNESARSLASTVPSDNTKVRVCDACYGIHATPVGR
jgi:hypothetical protein